MTAPVTTESVWRALSSHMFAVLAWVAPDGSARSAGIVYLVRDHKLLIGADKESWKERHIRKNPGVSITATLARRLPLLPWIKIPDATITFRGKARITPPAEVEPELAAALTKGMADDPMLRERMCVIEVIPEGEFITYGIDVSVLAMGDPQKAQGRAAVM